MMNVLGSFSDRRFTHARTHARMHALISGIIGHCDGVGRMEENP